jgi:hypothetical protein
MIKSRRIRWVGHVGGVGAKRNAYRLLVGKISLGRPRCKWVDNIKMDLGETGCDGVDWIGLAQIKDKWEALVNVVMKLKSCIKCCDTTKWLQN